MGFWKSLRIQRKDSQSAAFQKPVTCWRWQQGVKGTSSNSPVGFVPWSAAGARVPTHRFAQTNLLIPLPQGTFVSCPLVSQLQARPDWWKGGAPGGTILPSLLRGRSTPTVFPEHRSCLPHCTVRAVETENGCVDGSRVLVCDQCLCRTCVWPH